jgi:hypothetical protein
VEKIRTRTAEIHLDPLGILHFKLLADVQVDKEDALDNFLVIRHLTNNQPVLKLIDLSLQNLTIHKEALEFLEQKEAEGKTISRAIVTASFTDKILLQYFARLHKAGSPTQVFTSRETALHWLLEKVKKT